ncbi:MAG: FecR domain-containing protein [Aeromicrobium sp.]|nr:FecR domain-containing protein [Burkholderiales bacterium]
MNSQTFHMRLGRARTCSAVVAVLLPIWLASVGFAALAKTDAKAKATAAASASPERLYVYTAKQSDTFLKLAGRFLADRKNWTLLAKYNPKVDPVKIPVGHQIQIPVAAMRAELAGASVIAVRGQVEANNQKLVSGQTLAEKDKISTGDDGFVTIKLADGSTLTIQSKSTVELERTRRLANTTVGESVVRLERGRLETAVTKQNAAAKYEVRTPTSNMGVRGTVFRAGADETGKKAFSEVIEGAVGVASVTNATNVTNTPNAGALALNAGFGSVVEADKAPSEPVKLLPPPILPTLLTPQTRPVLTVAFPAVSGASGYRAQVALDRAFLQLVGETVSAKPNVELNDLPDGQLQLRVRAIDPAGLEGLDSVTSFSIAARPLPPRLVSPIGGASMPSGNATFSWQASPAASSYRLQLAASESFAPVVIDQAAITKSSFSVPIANSGSRYFWRVATVDATGKQGPFSDTQSASVRATKLKVTPVVMGNVSQLKWKGSSDHFYQIEISRREAFEEIVQTRVTPESTLVLDKLPKGTYFVRVRAVGNGSSPGNIKQPGEWSDTEAVEVFSGLF